MNFLVLGSSGQVGASLTRFLKKSGHSVLEFDLENSKDEDLRLYNNNLLQERMQQADFVFFLAFDVGGSRYLKTYQYTFDFIANNILLMQNTFDQLRRTNKPFIFASSQMSNMHYSPYGQLKALGESYTKALNGLAVKFWNVYGIEHDMSKSHVVTDFLVKARNHRVIEMMTDGTEQRQFLYADDCSDCLLTLAQKYHDIPREKELHVTSFKWNTILDVANIIAGIYSGTIVKAAASQDEVQRDKRNEPDPFILNFWKPLTDLVTGINQVNRVMT